MVDNLALLLAHLFLTLVILRSVKAERAARDDHRKSWRGKPRA